MNDPFFKRSDLAYNYDWTTRDDDPKLRGEPDHSLFSRHQGWEVLYMINKFGKLKGIGTYDAGRKIERMLQQLPSGTRSQENVRLWLSQNWSYYN